MRTPLVAFFLTVLTVMGSADLVLWAQASFPVPHIQVIDLSTR